jgi:hypothetical protein
VMSRETAQIDLAQEPVEAEELVLAEDLVG